MYPAEEAHESVCSTIQAPLVCVYGVCVCGIPIVARVLGSKGAAGLCRWGVCMRHSNCREPIVPIVAGKLRGHARI